MAFLATAELKYLIDRFRVFLVLIPIVIGDALCYMLPPYLATCYMVNTEQYESYFNFYIPEYLAHLFAYLDKYTTKQSVILAGTTLSMMIPVFTHDNVFMGQENSVADYNSRVMMAINFYNQIMSPDTMKTFLVSHRISYVMFSIDAPAYTSGFTAYPFLKEVYHNGSNSIVQVIP